jgi:hypothetical protein
LINDLALLAFNHVRRCAVGAIILRRVYSSGAASAASNILCDCAVESLEPAVRGFRSSSNADLFCSVSWAVSQQDLQIAPGTNPCKQADRAAHHHLVDMLNTVSPVPSDISIAQSVSSDQNMLPTRWCVGRHGLALICRILVTCIMLPQVQPARIGAIAEGLGLGPEEYDLYGTTQAKVCGKRPLEHLPKQAMVLSMADG